MKQAWEDLKSFVTIAFTLTIIALVIIVAIKGNWDIFQVVFTLFSNIATAVFTYYFTRNKTSPEDNTTNNDINSTSTQFEVYHNGTIEAQNISQSDNNSNDSNEEE